MKLAHVISALLGAALCSTSEWTPAQDVIPLPHHQLERAGLTVQTSPPPHWPSPPRAPEGAPNVLVILIDDAGFGASSVTGGPVPTPTFQQLADEGALYNDFNDAGICSATRAALLTGRNPNDVGIDSVVEAAAGYDGAISLIPKSAAMIPEILQLHGYSTAQFGKWHLAPPWELSAEGPFDHWPNGMGFDYSYSFMMGETNQWAPELVENRNFIEPPSNDPRYILDHDLANHAIHWIQQHEALAPQKPFFIYYAPGATHAPLQAPAPWIAKFRGKFDQGWDEMRVQTFERQKRLGVIPADAKLTPRPAVLPAWSSLTSGQRRVYAGLMEVYAGMLAYDDHEVGRVIREIKREGLSKSTLIIEIMGDNGASAEAGLQGAFDYFAVLSGVGDAKQRVDQLERHEAELGGPMSYDHYPAGWAWAMDTPFQWFKIISSHFGATRNAMVIDWPGHIKDHKVIRSQFADVVDIVPTILETANISPPAVVDGVEQMPLDGVSLLYTLNDPKAPSRRHTQYFDVNGNLAIYHDGWVAATTPQEMPWQLGSAKSLDFYDLHWELYHVDNDYSEADDLARSQPEKLQRLKDLFLIQGARNQIFPIRYMREGASPNPLALNMGRDTFTYWGRVTRVPRGVAPDLANKSYTITADVVIPKGGAQGMLVTQGGRLGGFGFYLLNDKPVFHYNLDELSQTTVAGTERVPAGRHDIAVHFAYDGDDRGHLLPSKSGGLGGKITLTVDGRQVATGHLEKSLVVHAYPEDFDVGSDTGTPVSEDYVVPFLFTGKIVKITVTYR